MRRHETTSGMSLIDPARRKATVLALERSTSSSYEDDSSRLSKRMQAQSETPHIMHAGAGGILTCKREQTVQGDYGCCLRLFPIGRGLCGPSHADNGRIET